MFSGDLPGVTNGVQTKQPSPAREAANSCKTEKKREQDRVSLSVWFYSSPSSVSIRPLPHAPASYYISLTFAFAEALIECIQYSGKDRPTVPTRPWLPVPDNLSKRDTSVEVRPRGVLRHHSRFLMVNLPHPIYKDVFMVATTRINFWLSKQLWRQEEADAQRRRVTLWDWNLRMVQKFVSPPCWRPYPSHLLSGRWYMTKVTVIIIHRLVFCSFSLACLLLGLISCVLLSGSNDLWRSVVL